MRTTLAQAIPLLDSEGWRSVGSGNGELLAAALRYRTIILSRHYSHRILGIIMYSHRISRKSSSNNTSAPQINPFAPRGFGKDTPQQSQPVQTQEELDAAYDEAKKGGGNLAMANIPAYPPGQEQGPPYNTLPSIQARYHQRQNSLMTSPENPIQRQSEEEESQPEEEIQTKLTVGAVGDPYEQEADRVAAQVMSMPDNAPQVQRLEEDENPVQMSSLVQSITPVVQRAFQGGENQTSGDLESRLHGSKGGGSPLAPEVQAFMQPRFGSKFNNVRVHTGGEAVQMSKELGAQAFTHGSDVYFGEGKSPGNNELTAHELTHVVQQTGGVQAKLATPQPTRPTYPSNHSSTTFRSSQRIGSSTRLALRPTKLPPVPNAILKQTLQRKVGQKLLWRKFWQVVEKKFGVKIAAAVTAAIADGPLPIGDLISIGLTIWMIWDLIQLWDMLWEETIKELEQEQANPQAIPHTDTEAIPREDTRKQKQDINFYHGTDEGTAEKFQGGMAVRVIGGGEFGQGFYTFIEQMPAEIVAEQYTRNRRPPLPRWGVVNFMIPVDIFIQYFGVSAIADVIQGKLGNILYFPDQQTPVEVTCPYDHPSTPGLKLSLTWKEFLEETRTYRKSHKREISWPYDLIVGPLKGKIQGYKHGVNQFMFNELGVNMLNNKKVKRNVVAQGDTGI